MNEETINPIPNFADLNRRSILGILVTGAIMALLTVVIAKILDHFVISPALCRDAVGSICQSSAPFSFHIASIIAAIVAVAMLVNVSVYRPLLVVLAVIVGTWGLFTTSLPFVTLPWYWELGVLAVINSLSLLAFAWILRTYNLVVALLLTVLLGAAMIAALSL